MSTTGVFADFLIQRSLEPATGLQLAPIVEEDPQPGLDPVTGYPPGYTPTTISSPLTFHLHDHLGNTRITFSADAPESVAIHYAADYFPYGKILRSYQACTSSPRFLTTHHERDAATSYDNRGARLYDAEIARFLGVDPLAQEFAAFSSYSYVLDNPIIVIDPSGAMAVYVDGVKQKGFEAESWQKEAEQNSNKPATIDAYVVNTNNLSKKELQAVKRNVNRILGRNGIPSGTIRYHFLDNLSDAESLPFAFRYGDRSLYQEFSNKPGKLGVTNDNFPDNPMLVRSGSRLSMDNIRKSYGDDWLHATGLILAHEFAHQLDAFSLAEKQGNLDGRGFTGGHYNGNNLLQPGQNLKVLNGPGGQQELLNDDVRKRVLDYVFSR